MEKPKNPKQYVGKKVRMIDKDLHKSNSSWYPKAGTIGTIVDFGFTDNTVCVDWGKNSGVGKNFIKNNYAWAVGWESIELVNDIQPNQPNMTDEEIWEMFKPKMKKLGINPEGEASFNELRTGKFICRMFKNSTVQKLVATAYRSGYGRGQKGRPFKIGEKKKKGGHWEPVDPNNLPKEGTKVKLKKEYCNYYGGVVEFGETGIVFHDASYVSRVVGYGVSFGEKKTIFLPLDRNIIASCLDMWMEDDE